MKKRNKKSICLAVCLLLIFACSISVSAHPRVRVYVDGVEVAFDQPPIIENDRTLVPMRKIFEAMGIAVQWAEPTQTITSTKGNDTVNMVIGKKEVIKNGQVVYQMDVPAKIVQERTLVPVRGVAVAFDAAVRWDSKNYIVDIQTTAQAESNLKEIKADDGTLLMTVSLTKTPIQSKEIAKQIEQEMQQTSAAMIAKYETMAKTAYADAKKQQNPWIPYYYMGTYTTTAENETYTSVTLEERIYTGQKEQKTLSSKIYDTKTKKIVDITELVPDTKQEIQTVMENGFLAIIAQNPSAFYDDAKTRLSKYLDKVGYYLTNDGIVFYINPEMIASQEAGVVAFSVAFDW